MATNSIFQRSHHLNTPPLIVATFNSTGYILVEINYHLRSSKQNEMNIRMNEINYKSNQTTQNNINIMVF